MDVADPWWHLNCTSMLKQQNQAPKSGERISTGAAEDISRIWVFFLLWWLLVALDLLPNLLTWHVQDYPGVRQKYTLYRPLGQSDDGVNSSINCNLVEVFLPTYPLPIRCVQAGGDAVVASAMHPKHVSHKAFVNLTLFFPFVWLHTSRQRPQHWDDVVESLSTLVLTQIISLILVLVWLRKHTGWHKSRGTMRPEANGQALVGRRTTFSAGKVLY